jgi:RNA polymerase-binding transcription factor DksA
MPITMNDLLQLYPQFMLLISSKLATASSAERRELIDAMNRLRHGSYGTCLDCDETISLARLRMLPQAQRCVSCQEEMDNAARAPMRRQA